MRRSIANVDQLRRLRVAGYGVCGEVIGLELDAMPSAHRNAADRADERRARWTGGRTRFAEAVAQDVQFWQQVPGGARLDAVFALATEWYGSPRAESSAGLRRSAGGVRQR